MSLPLKLVSGLALSALMPLTAHAVVYGGIDFPQGALSFADEVVAYTLPTAAADRPDAANSVGAHVLGAPNYVSGGACAASNANCPFASLGNGGSITVRFVDNRLTGSNSAALDLYVFEVGPAVEAMAVEVSRDGSNWLSVGTVSGTQAGIDLDKYGYGQAERFSHVRLTDTYADNYGTGASAGADLDAVGAISSVAAVPEPGSYALMLAGLAGLGWMVGRRSKGAIHWRVTSAT